MKDELKNTSIQITCLDEDGTVLKRVTSSDSGDIEDNEGSDSTDSQGGGSSTGSDSSTGSETAGGDPQNPGDGGDGLDQD